VPELSQPNSNLAHLIARVVRMFERYAKNIDPYDEQFLEFISQYLRSQEVNDPKALPFSRLYEIIKGGIREYLGQQESKSEPKK